MSIKKMEIDIGFIKRRGYHYKNDGNIFTVFLNQEEIYKTTDPVETSAERIYYSKSINHYLEQELNRKLNEERIICSAIWYKDSIEYVHQPKNITTGYVICGLRHHNCIAINAIICQQDIYHPNNKLEEVQGFLTSKDLFVTREEAAKIARNANQIKTEYKDILILYSENLY